MPTISVFDKRSAVHTSIAAGLVEMVRRDEKPNSYRYNKLSAALDKLLEAANDYTGNGFQGEDMRKAAELLDDIEKLINKKFKEPRREQGRAYAGNKYIPVFGKPGPFA